MCLEGVELNTKKQTHPLVKETSHIPIEFVYMDASLLIYFVTDLCLYRNQSLVSRTDPQVLMFVSFQWRCDHGVIIKQAQVYS